LEIAPVGVEAVPQPKEGPDSLFLSMPYLLLIEKADSFRFATMEAKNHARCSSGEISNRKNGQFLVQISWNPKS